MILTPKPWSQEAIELWVPQRNPHSPNLWCSLFCLSYAFYCWFIAVKFGSRIAKTHWSYWTGPISGQKTRVQMSKSPLSDFCHNGAGTRERRMFQGTKFAVCFPKATVSVALKSSHRLPFCSCDVCFNYHKELPLSAQQTPGRAHMDALHHQTSPVTIECQHMFSSSDFPGKQILGLETEFQEDIACLGAQFVRNSWKDWSIALGIPRGAPWGTFSSISLPNWLRLTTRRTKSEVIRYHKTYRVDKQSFSDSAISLILAQFLGQCWRFCDDLVSSMEKLSCEFDSCRTLCPHLCCQRIRRARGRNPLIRAKW